MVAKGKGAVVNIASMGSYCPGPYLAEYIATKHYMHSFTEVISATFLLAPQSRALGKLAFRWSNPYIECTYRFRHLSLQLSQSMTVSGSL